jgi:malate synthase
MKKEELLQLNAKLQKKIEDELAKHKIRRREFAKIFGWYKPHSGGYGDERLPIDPSWEQIFTEIGKLLAAKTFYDLEGNVSELECAIEDIQKTLKDWKEKLESRL